MDAHFPPGTALADGRYRVVRLLGVGGMGAVYEAENTTTHKRVAIKCLRPGHDPDEIDVARLVREAKASARIRHPNVVDVYDVVRSGSFVCLVMEYLDGEPLSSLLERGRLSVGSTLSLLVPVLRGVGAAHRQGVVHRDIKPANIFLAQEEDAPAPVPKLLDFGVSKLGDPGVDSLVLTRSGQIIGTPLYMPLEQFMGDKDIDARADIYALGVVLYEALTGEPPFRAESLAGLVVQLTSTSPTPPHVLSPDVPEALSAVVMRALARDRAERFASVEAMLEALAPFRPATTNGVLQVIPKYDSPLAQAATFMRPAEGLPLRSTGAAGRGAGLSKTTRVIAASALAVALSVLLASAMLRDDHDAAARVVAPSAATALTFPGSEAVSSEIASTTPPGTSLPNARPDDAGVTSDEPSAPLSSVRSLAQEPDSSTPQSVPAVGPSLVRRLNRGHRRETTEPAPVAQPGREQPSPVEPTQQQTTTRVPSGSGDRSSLRIRVPDSDEF